MSAPDDEAELSRLTRNTPKKGRSAPGVGGGGLLFVRLEGPRLGTGIKVGPTSHWEQIDGEVNGMLTPADSNDLASAFFPLGFRSGEPARYRRDHSVD
jgi:hypothetical protein